MSQPRKKVTVTVTRQKARRASRPIPPLVVKVPRRRNVRPSVDPALSQYLGSIANPFHIDPPPLGFGTFAQTSVSSLWSRSTVSPPSTDTCFVAYMDPCSTAANSTLYSAQGLSPFLALSTTAASATFLSAYTNNISLMPVNAPNFVTQADTFRAVSGAMKVTVRYPMTGIPGRLFALNTFESLQRITTMSVATMASHPEAVPVLVDGSGVAVIETKWIPRDSSSFTFTVCPTTANNHSNYVNQSNLIIFGYGWPANNFQIDVDAISHVEYNAGANEVSSTSYGPTVALATPLEAIAPLVRKISLVTNKTGVLCEDLAWNKTIRARGNYIGSLRSGLRGPSSSSIPASMSTSTLDQVMGAAQTAYNTADEAGYIQVVTDRLSDVVSSGLANFNSGVGTGLGVGASVLATRYLQPGMQQRLGA
jgi:hypothetical protein